MNKKILSAMLSVAMLFAAGSAFVSCKDYDDDIKNLQGQIDKLDQAVKDIKAQIEKGYLLTAVNQTAGGVTVTLSNGQTYEITNGKDGAAGKDGDAWTIEKVGDEYFWFKNGVNQNITKNAKITNGILTKSNGLALPALVFIVLIVLV